MNKKGNIKTELKLKDFLESVKVCDEKTLVYDMEFLPMEKSFVQSLNPKVPEHDLNLNTEAKIEKKCSPMEEFFVQNLNVVVFRNSEPARQASLILKKNTAKPFAISNVNKI